MNENRLNGKMLWAARGLCLAGAACSAGAQTDVFWSAAVSGAWADAANWSSPFVPGTAGNTGVRAVINLSGSYTVGLDFDATVSGFELSGIGASLSLTAPGATLVSDGNNLFAGSSIQGSAGSQIQTRGATVFSGSSSINGVSNFNLGGTTEFTGEDIDLCDTCVAITGSGVWRAPASGASRFRLDRDVTGSEVVIESGGSLSIAGTGTRMIEGTGGRGAFVNRGELLVDFDSGSSMFDIANADFRNTSGGMVRVESGTLRSDLAGSLSGTSLRGGDWAVGDSGTLDTKGAVIETIDVSVELSGAGSSFSAIDSLKRITTRAALRVMDGRVFTAGAGGDAFMVAGELEVGAGSVISVTADLMNLDAGRLSGGSFVVGGDLALAEGGGIDALAAALTLKGTGAITDGVGSDQLAALASIESAGTLALRESASFTTAGDLGLEGALDLGRGTSADVRGDLSAFQNGVFRDAQILVRGELIANNARIETVEGRLVVGLDGTILTRDGVGGTLDGLAFLSEIRDGGSFELASGRDLDLSGVSNTLSIEGGLLLGATAPGDADARLGSVLTADAVAFSATGSLATTLAGLDNFGRIEAGSVEFGAGGAGLVAGELIVVLAEGFSVMFGDRFLLIDAAGVLGKGFGLLTVQGVLGDGLFLEQFTDASGFGVVVVPGPGAFGVLGFGALAITRRRRGVHQ